MKKKTWLFLLKKLLVIKNIDIEYYKIICVARVQNITYLHLVARTNIFERKKHAKGYYLRITALSALYITAMLLWRHRIATF